MKLHIPNLLAAMAQKGVKQSEAARGLGWSEAKLSRLMNNKTGDVTLTQISELARFLGVSEAILVDLEDVAQTDDERRILRLHRIAEERQRALALQVLELRHIT